MGTKAEIVQGSSTSADFYLKILSNEIKSAV